jgi:CheY-like chemotaxis protein
MASFPKTLVVEDDPNTALLLNLAFKKAGVTSPMHFVNDGAEAIQYLGGKELFNNVASSTLPGLMLLSEGGPRLSGFSVLRWLWLRPHLRPSCVVVLSTSNSPKDMAQATLLGADHCLMKPADPANYSALVETLQQFCKSKRVPLEPPDAGRQLNWAAA